jgi:tRNA-Thr(GGU) m(6)t(6)A37 methyltransferase TsaA
MNLIPIGVIHSPCRQAAGTPVQVAYAGGYAGEVEIFPSYLAGLKDLADFERVWLIYWFDRATSARLEVTPYLDTAPHGIFATRSPCRPNPLGFSPVRLLGIEGNRLRVTDLDILDGTPLLDLKPYVPAFDSFAAKRIGWCSQMRDGAVVRADDRFTAQ